MEETVVFKFEVFDESIRKKVMVVIWESPGRIDSVDEIKEEGKVKVIGEFDKVELKQKLEEIDENVEMIEDEEENKPHNPWLSRLKNGHTTKQEEKKPSNAGRSSWASVPSNDNRNLAKRFGAGAGKGKGKAGHINQEQVNVPKPQWVGGQGFNYRGKDNKKAETPFDQAKGLLAGKGKGKDGFVNQQKANALKRHVALQQQLRGGQGFNYGGEDYQFPQPPLFAGAGKLIKKQDLKKEIHFFQEFKPGNGHWTWKNDGEEKKSSSFASSSISSAQKSGKKSSSFASSSASSGLNNSKAQNSGSAMTSFGSAVQGTASALSSFRATSSRPNPSSTLSSFGSTSSTPNPSSTQTRKKESKSDAKKGKRHGT